MEETRRKLSFFVGMSEDINTIWLELFCVQTNFGRLSIGDIGNYGDKLVAVEFSI